MTRRIGNVCVFELIIPVCVVVVRTVRRVCVKVLTAKRETSTSRRVRFMSVASSGDERKLIESGQTFRRGDRLVVPTKNWIVIRVIDAQAAWQVDRALRNQTRNLSIRGPLL